jgi:hypothetical protein
MKWSLRDWVYIAIFGALWGAVEISLGSYLHVLFPSLTNTFFTGLILAFLGIAIALLGRQFLPHTGALLMIGVVTALLKALSPGGVKIGPMIAILAQSLLMEGGILALGAERPMGHMLAGALAIAWNTVHPLIMFPLLLGQSVAQAYIKILKDGSATLGLDVRYGILILLILFLIRLGMGGAAGWLAWNLGHVVRRRVAR